MHFTNLLLYLMTKIRTGKTDEKLELLGGISYEIFLEFLLLGLVRPREAFVKVETYVDASGDCEHTPSHSPPDLVARRK